MIKGFNPRKTIKVGENTRATVSKSGVSTSTTIGNTTISVSPKGKKFITINLGGGLRFRQKIG